MLESMYYRAIYVVLIVAPIVAWLCFRLWRQSGLPDGKVLVLLCAAELVGLAMWGMRRASSGAW